MELEISIQNWLRGDEQAFTHVFYYYHTKLLRFSERFMTDHQLIEELVMNVLLKIWKNRDSITDYTTFNAYLYKAMRNEIISSFRTVKKTVVPLEALGEEPHVGSDYEYNQLAHHYQVCVNKLPPRRKQIFLMSLEQGMTYAQIAKQMGISVNTVQKQVLAAVQTIRRELHLHAYSIPANEAGLVSLCILFSLPMLN